LQAVSPWRQQARVAAGDEITPSDVLDCVAKLITKSLVVADSNNAAVHYRLLETTRTYALEKLTESGESDTVARRLANHYHEFCRLLEVEREASSAAEQVAVYRRYLDNLRAALDWAFSSNGDGGLGVMLTIACLPVWSHLSLMDECRERVQGALARLETVSRPDARQKMLLYAALGSSLMQTKGPVFETSTAWAKALELAEQLGHTETQLRSLWGLWVYRFNIGGLRAALALAERFCRIAALQAEPANLSIGDPTGCGLPSWHRCRIPILFQPRSRRHWGSI